MWIFKLISCSLDLKPNPDDYFMVFENLQVLNYTKLLEKSSGYLLIIYMKNALQKVKWSKFL